MPSSGRCAGPTTSDLARMVLPAREVPGPVEAYDLSGTTTLGAGPYRVTLVQRLTAARGTLELIGSRIVRRPVTRAQALRDLRAGRLSVSGATGPIAGLLTEIYRRSCAVSSVCGRPSAAACRATDANQFVLSANQAGRSLAFSLQSVGFGDPWRTECPGPSSLDIIGANNVLAGGSLPLRDLGERYPRLAPSVFTHFRSAGYAGTAQGMIPFVLQLARVHVSTRRMTVPAGVPVFPGGSPV